MEDLITHPSLAYYLTENMEEADFPYSHPDKELKKQLNEIYEQLEDTNGAATVIEQLENLSKRHPDVPIILNFLSVAYDTIGNKEKAFQYNDDLIAQFPYYIHGILNKVTQLLIKEEYEKVPEILGSEFDLGKLLPERKILHIDEFLKFQQTVVDYFLKTSQVDEARNRSALIMEVAPDSDITMQTFSKIASYNLDNLRERMEEEEAQATIVHAYPKRQEKPNAAIPDFHHEEIRMLFENGEASIEESLLETIQGLPRETVIADLNLLIKTYLEQFEAIRNWEIWEENYPATAQVLYLLGDLKAYDSLPLILDFLRQEEEFHDLFIHWEYWAYLWVPIYQLGQDRLAELKDFVLEKDNYAKPRRTVNSAVAQVAQHQPQRRQEVIRWFDDLMQYLVDHRDEEGLIDSYMLAFMVWDLMDIHAYELTDTVETLFDHFFIAPNLVGDKEKVLAELHGEGPLLEPEPLLSTIEFHNELNKIEEDEDEEALPYPDEPDEEPSFPRITEQEPYVRNQPKVGRNDPCPCGSGKKYKKCCMEK